MTSYRNYRGARGRAVWDIAAAQKQRIIDLEKKVTRIRDERDAAWTELGEQPSRFSKGGIVDPSPILTAEQWSDLKRLQADRAAGSTPSLWLNRAAHDAVGVLDPTLGTNEQRRAEAARQAREILTVTHKVTEAVGEASTTETTEDAPLTEDVIRLAAYIYNNTVVSNRTMNDGPRPNEQKD